MVRNIIYYIILKNLCQVQFRPLYAHFPTIFQQFSTPRCGKLSPVFAVFSPFIFSEHFLHFFRLSKINFAPFQGVFPKFSTGGFPFFSCILMLFSGGFTFFYSFFLFFTAKPIFSHFPCFSRISLINPEVFNTVLWKTLPFDQMLRK